MNDIRLNSTPIRTCKNYNINDIVIKDLSLKNKITKFSKNNIDINTSKSITVSEKVSKIDLKYGNGKILEKQINNNSNVKLNLLVNKEKIENIKEKDNNDSIITFTINEENKDLVENIEITALENSNANIFIKYLSDKKTEGFHNGVIRVTVKENAKIKVTIINGLNDEILNFLSMNSNIEKNGNLEFNIIDLGAKNSILNYYCDLSGEKSNNKLNSIYLGKKEKIIDLNYIIEVFGEKSNANIEVQGAITDNVKKNFKGTIDFKRGCKKSVGAENENCILLSDKAKSIAMPILLCTEEDVEGAHSTSTGKMGEKELFYIMSRGFTLKEALKLMVKAKFNQIIENIDNEEIKEEVIKEIDRRLN